MKPETMSSTPTAEERAEAWLTQKGMWPEQMSSRINIGPAKQSPTTKELFATCIREEVEPLEAELVKLRALVPAGDAIAYHMGYIRRMIAVKDCRATLKTSPEVVQKMYELIVEWYASVRATKSQGFTPTNTTEG